VRRAWRVVLVGLVLVGALYLLLATGGEPDWSRVGSVYQFWQWEGPP